MTVGELRRLLEAAPDDHQVYFHDLDHGRLPVETLQVETWEEKFVHTVWDAPVTVVINGERQVDSSGGRREVVTASEVKGVVLG